MMYTVCFNKNFSSLKLFVLLLSQLHIIIEPTTHTINRLFNTSIVPQEMKTASVIPIHKSSD